MCGEPPGSDVHYKGLIGDDLLAVERARIADEIERLTYDAKAAGNEAVQSFELAARFEKLLQVLDVIRIAYL